MSKRFIVLNIYICIYPVRTNSVCHKELKGSFMSGFLSSNLMKLQHGKNKTGVYTRMELAWFIASQLLLYRTHCADTKVLILQLPFALKRIPISKVYRSNGEHTGSEFTSCVAIRYADFLSVSSFFFSLVITRNSLFQRINMNFQSLTKKYFK